MAFRRNRSLDMVGFDVGTVRNLHSAFLRDGEAALKLSGRRNEVTRCFGVPRKSVVP